MFFSFVLTHPHSAVQSHVDTYHIYSVIDINIHSLFTHFYICVSCMYTTKYMEKKCNKLDNKQHQQQENNILH